MGLRQACGLFPGLIEIATPFDHLAAEAAHGLVFFDRVALRHHDQRAQTQRPCRQRQALAMVAAGSGDDAPGGGVRAFEPMHEGNAAAHLESPRRRMVFMLDPHRAPQPFSQQWPRVLGSGRHHLVHLVGRLFDVVASQSVHEHSP
ncbi:hypothetical protein D3C84_835960 [compost metagenome]